MFALWTAVTLRRPLLDRVLEGVARDPLRRRAGDDLDALGRVGPDAVLDAGVQVLGVLADDDQVDVVVARLDALHASAPGGRWRTGSSAWRSATFTRAEAGADRRRDRPLDGDAVAADRLDHAVRERRALGGDGGLAGVLHVPVEADPGRLEDAPRGLGQLRADAVAGDQGDGVAHWIHLACGRSKRRRTGMQV